MHQPQYDAELFAEIAQSLHRAGSTAETAEQILGYACEVLQVEHAGITMIRRGRQLETLAASDEIVEQADRLQHDLDEGPCRDSAWLGEVCVSQDLANEPRWPRWSPAVAELGLRSVLAVELTAGTQRVGSLNLFSTRMRTFSNSDIACGTIFARHVAVALDASHEAENLAIALDGRKLIGQAQGMLMERFKLTGDQAFDVLKRYSQETNIKLRTVAEMLIETNSFPDRSSKNVSSLSSFDKSSSGK